ncbi:MAG: hypothetical protein SFV23_24205 [Planctomycetaceae bacterium]|nr:hypothetical protein [Planctomycetaceae bacterium]
MMEILRSLGDDQLALMGCVAALLTGGIVLQLTYALGPASRLGSTPPQIRRLPQPLRRSEDRAA